MRTLEGTATRCIPHSEGLNEAKAANRTVHRDDAPFRVIRRER